MHRSTIVSIVLFAVVLGAAYYFNNRARTTAEAEATATATETPIEYLIPSSEGLPDSIRIASKAGDQVEVARNADNAWVLKLPAEAAADQAAVEAAVGQVATLRILERVPGLAPSDVGLDTPEYTITFLFKNRTERVVQVGVATPTGSGYYVQAEAGGTVIIGQNALDAILGLLTNPPYAPPETPPAP